MKHFITALISTAFLAVSVNTSAGMDKESADAQRQEIQDVSQAALAQLYQENPSTRAEIEKAAGYAVFSNEGGGILHNNHDGKDLFMKMLAAGSSIDTGGTEFSIVLIFETAQAMNNFKDVGWDISGQINSAGDSALTGAGVSGAASVMPPSTVFQLSKNGVVSNPDLEGVKFVMEEKLN